MYIDSILYHIFQIRLLHKNPIKIRTTHFNDPDHLIRSPKLSERSSMMS